MIHHLFKLAKSWHYLAHNPFEDALTGPGGDKWLVEQTKTPRFLTQDQIQDLLDELEHLPYLRRMAAFAILTGFDHGDILELEWKAHVDEDQQVITKRRMKLANRSDIKDERVGLVQIYYGDNPEIQQILSEAKADQPRGTARVFTRSDGSQVSTSSIDQSMNTAREKAGLPADHRGFKVLRHTFASQQIMHGTDLYTLKHLMGHTKVATTEKYAHLIGDLKQREAMGRIAGLRQQ